MNWPLPTITLNGSSGLVGRFNTVTGYFAICGYTILCVLPHSINTVTGYVLMKPVIRKVWANDIPKYAAVDKDHNCGVNVSSGGTVSFGSDIERCSSLSTIIRNWGGEHLCPGQTSLGNESKGLKCDWFGFVVGFVGGVWGGEDLTVVVWCSFMRVASWFLYDEGPKRSLACRLNASQDPRRWMLSKCWYQARASSVKWNAISAIHSSGGIL
nr:hypothetical protein [Tanacetum cinerariifolium]